ncbi:MAG: Ryanodine receptor Ryr [Prevotella sp.]|nr:Ryanodine receptor Ryr [Prevotella sp.]
MVRVLQTIDDYTPQPVQLSDVTLTGDLLELREAIAENAHDVWAAARISQGWIYGPERDDHSLHHPDIVPYCSLPDSEKEYDRIMALDTIKLVQKLGFDIVRRL